MIFSRHKKPIPHPDYPTQETLHDNILAVTAWGVNGSVKDATGIAKPDSYPAVTAVNNDGQLVFTIPGTTPFPNWGYSIRVTAPGYRDYEFRVNPAENPSHSYDINLTPVNQNYTRDQVCGSNVTLGGLMIQTKQYGMQPWFEIAYQCLNDPDDRASVRKQKKAAGDTAVILEFFTHAGFIYPDRPGNATWLGQCFTRSGELEPNWFKSLVEEILADGMVPWVVYDGDNGEDPNDGYPNALRQLPIVTSLLAEYNQNILYCRFWDGVFYGTTPDQVVHFGQEFRKLLPNGHLAIEFNPGHIPVGEGGDDYLPGGRMQDYDVICGEFEYPQYQQDSTWQIVARLVPSYNRPPDQPSGDDPNPPYYLRVPNARGQWYFKALECGVYQWVRWQVSEGQLRLVGNYFRNMGCYSVGLPS